MNQYRSKVNWHATENQNSSGFFFMLTNMHLIYVNTAKSDVLHVDNISCPEGGGDRNMHQLCLLKYK